MGESILRDYCDRNGHWYEWKRGKRVCETCGGAFAPVPQEEGTDAEHS